MIIPSLQIRRWTHREVRYWPKVTHLESAQSGFQQALWGQNPCCGLLCWTTVRTEGPCPACLVSPLPPTTRYKGRAQASDREMLFMWSCLSS